MSHRALVMGIISLGISTVSCQKEDGAGALREPAGPVGARISNSGEPALPEHVQPRSDPQKPPKVEVPMMGETKERVFGRADLDPTNDDFVAPPDAVPECHARLDAAGVKYQKAELPLKQVVREIATCGCHDAVTVTETPQGMKLVPPAVVSCQMALALTGLESLIQELAEEHLGERVRTLHQGGTYSCRKMARFDLVSEHSYGNAIDVFAFTLKSGKKVSVMSDFGALNAEVDGLSSKAKFLRSLSSAAYDRDITSVSLSPYWDALHRDHFHFDMARYRVDGSRPR